MHYRRLACLLLGVWLGGSAIFAVLSWRRSRLPDRLIANPAPAAVEYLNEAGRDVARELLRHHAAEAARRNAEAWSAVQILLAAALLGVLLFGTHEGKLSLLLAALLLVTAALDCFFLTPEAVARGRLLEFAPPGTNEPERARLALFVFGHWAAQAGSMAGAAGLAAWLVWQRGHRSGNARFEVHAIDKADHGHVNR